MSETYRLQKPSPDTTSPVSDAATPLPVRTAPPPKRLVSLDAYRGFIMTMLAASGFGMAQFAKLKPDNEVWNSWSYEWFQSISAHFTHPPWVSITGWAGVSFWDLIQPAFMFMVGVAMPFSYARREAMGSASKKRHLHAAFRAIILTLMGVFLYSLRVEQTTWIFTNVLAQIGLGYFFAYLLLGRTPQIQGVFWGIILFGYWGWFMLNAPPEQYDYDAVAASVQEGEVFEGRFAPWSKNANAAHFFDVWLLNKLRMPTDPSATTDQDDSDTVTAVESDARAVVSTDNDHDSGRAPSLIRQWWFSSPERFTHNGGGYATLNFIPSIATMILGMLCGQLMLSREAPQKKLLILFLAGLVCLATGVLAHHTVCPIVKRIWTPSWVLFSGGYVIWMLALFYLLFDILPLSKLAFPLVVVGMNSIVMYMMGQMMRPWVTEKIVQTHFGGMLRTLFGPTALSRDGLGAIIAPTATFLVFWLIAFWMYRNRFFVRV